MKVSEGKCSETSENMANLNGPGGYLGINLLLELYYKILSVNAHCWVKHCYRSMDLSIWYLSFPIPTKSRWRTLYFINVSFPPNSVGEKVNFVLFIFRKKLMSFLSHGNHLLPKRKLWFYLLNWSMQENKKEHVNISDMLPSFQC